MGYPNVDEFLKMFTARQFFEWQAYEQIDPWGERRQDYRIASLGALIANVNRDSKKRPEPYTIEDFLLKFGEPEKKQQTWQEQEMILNMWAQAMGAAAKES